MLIKTNVCSGPRRSTQGEESLRLAQALMMWNCVTVTVWPPAVGTVFCASVTE